MEPNANLPKPTREPEYAGFLVRSVAFFIDVIILFVVFVPLYTSDLTDFKRNVIMLGGEFIYLAVFWIWRGQTPGMMVAGAKIIRSDGKALTADRAILRCVAFMVYWIPWIPNIPVLAPFLLWIGWDLKKQGLHDKLAGTMVVRVRPQRGQPENKNGPR